MSTKDDIIAAVQAVADATGVSTILASMGAPGAFTKIKQLGALKPTGQVWSNPTSPWQVFVEGLANWLDGSGATPGTVKITTVDSMAGYLASKLVAGVGVTLTVLNPGGVEQLRVDAGGGVVQLPVYRQAAEPALPSDDDQAFWIDTDDGNKAYLVMRRGSGDQVKVELS